MSTMPTYADNSAPPFERRLQSRLTVSALAYLDIGADNGGIALNLSENGMALQAVAPLESKADVNLRIQLPHSQSRIETLARIVWLGQSNRQAGVRFVDMPAESRSQIREWIRSQAAPGASLETPIPVPQKETLSGPSPQRETISTPPRKRENPPDSQKDKWLSLMAEFEAATPKQVPSRSGDRSSERSVSSEVRNDAGPSVKPPSGIVLNPFSRRTRPVPDSPTKDAVAGAPEQESAHYLRSTPVPEPFGAPLTDDGASSGTAEERAILGWPVSEPPMDTDSAPPSTVLYPERPEPAAPLATTDPSVVPAAIASSFASALAAARKKSAARKWVGIAALFLVFCGLCFGFGTWFGSQRAETPSSETVTVATKPAPSLTPSSLSTSAPNPAPRSAVEPQIASAQKPRPASLREASHTRKPTEEIRPSSALALSTRTEVPFPPAQFSAAAPNTIKSAEKTVQPVPANFAAATPAETATPVAPAQTIVEGHVLRPTDRFNPCHLTYRLEPTYPPEARQQQLQGAVKIHLTVGTDGAVRNVKLISGSPLLALAALDAAQYWRYMPALLNGQPIESEQDIEIDFRLPR